MTTTQAQPAPSPEGGISAPAPADEPKGRPDIITKRLAALGWAFSAPALIVIAAVTIFPIVFSVVMSLSNVNVTGSGFHLGGFTLANYSLVLHSGRWMRDLVFTVGYTVVTVVVELVLGTAIALVLERMVAGRGWMMALLLIPWSMITVVSAQLWSYIYQPVYGVADALLTPLVGHTIVLLGNPVPAIISMMIADVWKTTPFVAIIVLAGLVMLPGDLYEAAEVDGASGWSTFWRITLPLLRPTMALAVLFRILQAFGLFDLPYVLTPGVRATESLAVLGWQVMFTDSEYGPGAAVASTTAALVLLGCLLFLKVFRAQASEEAA